MPLCGIPAAAAHSFARMSHKVCVVVTKRAIPARPHHASHPFLPRETGVPENKLPRLKLLRICALGKHLPVADRRKIRSVQRQKTALEIGKEHERQRDAVMLAVVEHTRKRLRPRVGDVDRHGVDDRRDLQRKENVVIVDFVTHRRVDEQVAA